MLGSAVAEIWPHNFLVGPIFRSWPHTHKFGQPDNLKLRSTQQQDVNIRFKWLCLWIISGIETCIELVAIRVCMIGLHAPAAWYITPNWEIRCLPAKNNPPTGRQKQPTDQTQGNTNILQKGFGLPYCTHRDLKNMAQSCFLVAEGHQEVAGWTCNS